MRLSPLRACTGPCRRQRLPKLLRLHWDSYATPQAKQFLWLVHRQRLPSRALLFYRNITDSAECAFCQHEEDQAHIFFLCPKAALCWSFLCPGQDFSDSQVGSLWGHEFLEGMEDKIKTTVITCVLWNLWKSRNAYSFEGQDLPPAVTLRRVVANLFQWSHRAERPGYRV